MADRTQIQRTRAQSIRERDSSPDSAGPKPKRRRISMETETELQTSSDQISRAPVKRPFEDSPAGTDTIPTPRRKWRRICPEEGELQVQKRLCSPATGRRFKINRECLQRSTGETFLQRSTRETFLQRSTGEASSVDKTVPPPTVRIQEQPLMRESQTSSDKKDTRVRRIWIIGSSYVRRAEKDACQKFGQTLGLDATVSWFGQGGMRWSGVLPRFYKELSARSTPPDVLVIHAGGNDLGQTPAEELAAAMRRDLDVLHAQFPCMNIVFSSINERQQWRYGQPRVIDKERKTVNALMRKAVVQVAGEIVEHPLLRHFTEGIFLPDRVHFTKAGNSIFVSSIRTVLKKILQQST